MFQIKDHKLAITIILIAGIFWSFGPYVVRHIDQAETVPWQYLFTRGIVIFTLLNLFLFFEEGNRPIVIVSFVLLLILLSIPLSLR